MLRLRTKITFSYIIISLIIVAIISIVANVMLENIFRNYVMNIQEQKSKEIIRQITDRYNRFSNDWSYDVLDSIGVNALENSLIVRVKDVNDKYIWDAWTHNNGTCTALLQNISENMFSRYPNFDGKYVETNYEIKMGGKKIGSVDIGYFGPFYYTDNDLNFINSLNIMLVGSAVFSLVIAILLGLFVSFWLSTPILKVIYAAGQIKDGKFSERVLQKSKTKELNELIHTINNLAETLETAEGLRKRLTADVAHELRTPLTTLRSHMEAMIQGIWKPDQGRLKSCHDEIMRLTRMVNDLKKLSEFESENLRLNREIFPFHELMERIVINFEAEFANKEVSLVLNNKYHGNILADRDKISQIFVNIISNALQYTNPNGAVRISGEKIKESVVITISDTGIGISKKDLPYIFERFYRTDKSRNTSTGGSGIGLTIAKTLLLAHKGEITVNSKLGHGTTFTVSLPVKSQQ